MVKPNFFIVGAPKCGTTAINDYLAQHPDIFMAPKELHFFGLDLKVRTRIAESEYLTFFESGVDKKVRGEASVWYLFSKTAAQEIKVFSPDAKILIMLRNPVEVLYSLHSQHLYDGNENVKDFEKAIGLDEQRKKGYHLPHSVDYFILPPYKESVLFADQVQRYFDVFGRENVFVLLYDDFIRNLQGALTDLLLFLNVDTDFKIENKIINANKKTRLFGLHLFLKRPPAIARKAARFLFPSRDVRHRIMEKLFKFNIVTAKRKKMNEQLRLKLIDELKDEIITLEKVINKDLSAWIK
ncbi:MAG: sulfotransferase [Chitinophagaceae bacterium]